MSDTDDLRAALSDVITWTRAAMDTCRPNSGMYAAAERDQRHAERKLAELRSRR